MMTFHLYWLALLFCVLASSAVADHHSSESDESTENAPPYTCEEGWIPYATSQGVTCIWFSNITAEFIPAADECMGRRARLVRLDDEDKLVFLRANMPPESQPIWTGGKGDYHGNLLWHAVSFGYGRRSSDFVNTAFSIDIGDDYINGQCLSVSSTEGIAYWACHRSEYFACERRPVCDPWTFGGSCEQECHCKGESCSMYLEPNSLQWGVSCVNGCERGWYGNFCHERKEAPEVKYYCVNSPDEWGKFVHIRVNTRNNLFKHVYGVNSDGRYLPYCRGSTKQFNDETGEFGITIYVNNFTIGEMMREECFGEREDNNVFFWDLAVKEQQGVQNGFDLTAHITCDFNTADTLVREEGHSVGGLENANNQSHVSIDREQTSSDIQLQLVDAASGEPVTEAMVGSSVRLQVSYGLQEGSILQGVLPHSCFASSADGNFKHSLTDGRGCGFIGSPFSERSTPFLYKEDKVINSPHFGLFTFDGESDVTFSCSFELCFENCKRRLETRCRGRQKRDTGDEETGPMYTSFSTVRVLPFVEEKRDEAPDSMEETFEAPESRIAHDFHDDDHKFLEPDAMPFHEPDAMPDTEDKEEIELAPHFYVNPATLTMFLVLLIAMFLLFTSLMCVMQRSIREIRRDVEVKRSCENYVISGLAQEKDKTVLLP